MATLTRDSSFGDDRSSTASEVDLRRVEVTANVRFPDAYRSFLLAYNGGSFKECIFHGSALGPLVVSSFFSLDGENGDPLDVVIENMREFLPVGSVPFAEDPGGNVFYIGLRDSGRVNFWDHETRQSHVLFDDFGGFVDSLTSDD